jgi:A/G-specific adenine glycosylase
MLQQTRVAVVTGRYAAFLARFPDVHALAEAPPADVLALWSGLGYYRRARAMHAAARLLCHQHGGRFPQTSHTLAQLPGIGRYTAAAIASIAFDERVAVVDGNVERVLARMFSARSRPADSWALAGALLCPTRPGDFNQAMMELGATICVPGEPRCAACPVLSWCATRGRGAPPVRAKRVRCQVHYRLALRRSHVFLVLRPEDASLMPGMWELPEAQSGGSAERGFVLRHSITVTDYEVHVSRGRVSSRTKGEWVDGQAAARMPLTGLARKILRHARIIQSVQHGGLDWLP